MSIRVKLVLAVLAPLLIVFAVVLAIDYHFANQQAIELAQRHLSQMAANHAARLDNRFAAIEQAALAIAETISDADPPLRPRIAMYRVRALFGRNVNLRWAAMAMEPTGSPGSRRVGLYVLRIPKRPKLKRPVPTKRPAKPTVKRTTPPRFYIKHGDLTKDEPDFHEQYWYRQARDIAAVVWSEPPPDPDGGPPVARCSVPLIRDGHVFGVVAVDFTLEPLGEYVSDNPPVDGYSMLISPSSLVICHPDPAIGPKDTLDELAVQHASPPLHDLALRIRQGCSGIVHFTDFHTSRRSWAVFEPLATAGFSFAVIVPEASITQPAQQRFSRNSLLFLAGLMLTVTITLLVSLRITRPIAKLVPVVRQIARGDLDVRAKGIRGGDEIGEFAHAFNKMIVNLKVHVADLARETAARQAFESELNVAREIQKSLLPSSLPDTKGLALHAVNVPANHVAGDFFDFFFVNDNTLAVLIADVVGKGAAAALFMAVTRTVIRNQAFGGASPAEVLTTANRVIAADNARDMFVTLFFGHYNISTGELIFSNAGHCPPVIGTHDGNSRELTAETDPILGVFPGQQYHQHRTQLNPLDSLVLYTDGVTEAMNADDAMFSEEHLNRLVANNPTATPEELCELIVESVETFRHHPRQDDVTVLVLRRTS